MRTEDFLDRIATQTDPDLLWSVATDWLSARGFDKVLHLSIANGHVTTRTTLGAAFERHYRDEGLARHDPFPKYCLAATGSVSTGIDYMRDHHYLVPDERKVIWAAADVEFRAGFSLVVRRDSLGCEGWNLGSSLNRVEVDRIRQDKSVELRLALMALRGRLQNAATARLTKRERQVMDLLAEGLRTKAIAGELGIAEVTVELHMKNARTKLGALTRDQALMLYRITG
ncbi:LuxR C-terminal-related transcriptional regulator [Roseibium aquae]|nr:LuxR C-terminal-related transcriptional regulator [Roseibium aquae]